MGVGRGGWGGIELLMHLRLPIARWVGFEAPAFGRHKRRAHIGGLTGAWSTPPEAPLSPGLRCLKSAICLPKPPLTRWDSGSSYDSQRRAWLLCVLLRLAARFSNSFCTRGSGAEPSRTAWRKQGGGWGGGQRVERGRRGEMEHQDTRGGCIMMLENAGKAALVRCSPLSH